MWGPRIPFVDEVLVFDKKIQYLSAAATEVQIGGNDRVVVDYYVLWQIDSPLAFRRSFPGNLLAAESQIQGTVGSLVKSTIGTLSMGELLARSEALDTLAQRSTEALIGDGVRVIDVRINRTELPLPSQKGYWDKEKRPRMVGWQECEANNDGEPLVNIFAEVRKNLFSGQLYYVDQAHMTKAGIIATKQEYSDNSVRMNDDFDIQHPAGDCFHMNPGYGALMWEELVTAMRVLPELSQ